MLFYWCSLGLKGVVHSSVHRQEVGRKTSQLRHRIEGNHVALIYAHIQEWYTNHSCFYSAGLCEGTGVFAYLTLDVLPKVSALHLQISPQNAKSARRGNLFSPDPPA